MMEKLKAFTNENGEVLVFSKDVDSVSGEVSKVVEIFHGDEKLWEVAEHNVGNIETANGRSLFSTDAVGSPATSVEEQKANIEKVIAFNEEVFNAHKNDAELLNAFMRDDYMQHNANVADGKEGFVNFTNFFFTLKPEMKIYKTFSNEDGEVAVFFKCICHANGMINKVCDIYRLKDGKLSEHWDVVEHNVSDF